MPAANAKRDFQPIFFHTLMQYASLPTMRRFISDYQCIHRSQPLRYDSWSTKSLQKELISEIFLHVIPVMVNGAVKGLGHMPEKRHTGCYEEVGEGRV